MPELLLPYVKPKYSIFKRKSVYMYNIIEYLITTCTLGLKLHIVKQIAYCRPITMELLYRKYKQLNEFFCDFIVERNCKKRPTELLQLMVFFAIVLSTWSHKNGFLFRYFPYVHRFPLYLLWLFFMNQCYSKLKEN